jgi:hypothetical protein
MLGSPATVKRDSAFIFLCSCLGSATPVFSYPLTGSVAVLQLALLDKMQRDEQVDSLLAELKRKRNPTE